MRCPKCGSKLSENVKFCSECGESVAVSSNDYSQKADADDCLKKTSIKYKQAEACITESEHDAPKISQLSDKGKKFWNSLCNFSKLTVICIAVCILLSIIAFLGRKTFAGIITFVQIAFFIVSWLLYKEIIKGKKQSLYLIFCILGFLFIVPYFFCFFQQGIETTNPVKASKVDQEMISEKLRWPQNELAQLVPKPKSEVGYILFEDSGEITICVGETAKRDFNTYIDACAEKGFDTNVSRSEGSYFGNNAEGYRLLLNYEEDDVMIITVMEPAYLVKIELDCESNLFFSKYDIDVYIDDRLAGTLEHGKKDIFDTELEKGDHTLKVTKVGDTSVDGTARFDVPESIKVSYTLQCSNDGIHIEEEDTEILTPIDENMARIPAASDDYKKKAYVEVQSELEKAGFTNINAKVVEDLSEEQADQAGIVEEISIGGATQFQKADIYEKNIEIIITYHTTAPQKAEAKLEKTEPKEEMNEDGQSVKLITDQLEPYVGKTVTEFIPYLAEMGYTATYTAENTGDDFTDWIQSDSELQGVFIVTGFHNINEKAHTVEVMMLGKDTIMEREEKIEMTKELEEKLGADAAWAAVIRYGERNYPSFKLHTVTGVLAETVEDENTWFLKAYCDVKISGEKLKNLTCEARVTGTEANPKVIDFNIY